MEEFVSFLFHMKESATLAAQQTMIQMVNCGVLPKWTEMEIMFRTKDSGDTAANSVA